MKSIAQEHDCLLIDLDGTVFCGRQPTGGAVQSLSQVRSRKLFVTNNASRSADEVAAHLCELGFTATGEDVVTSAQSAAHLLAGQLAPGARVLIVGTEALANEVAAVGLRPVRRFEDRPDAVVQGLSIWNLSTTGYPSFGLWPARYGRRGPPIFTSGHCASRPATSGPVRPCNAGR